MKIYLIMGAAILCFAATTPALAQTSTTVTNPDGGTTTTTQTVEKKSGGTASGAVGGAIAGALVAGPVGAVVGGVAGAAVGHSIAPPSHVRTYVTTQSGPPVSYSGKVAVGRTLDGEVVWQDVPDYPKYRWAYLNGQRVVIDNDTRKVVAIY
jgi:hypothetical protein